MYWTAFAASVMSSGFLIVYAQRMRADAKTSKYLVQIELFGLGVLLFGVANGCMVGIFTYRRGKGPVLQAAACRQGNSVDNSDSNHHSDKLG